MRKQSAEQTLQAQIELKRRTDQLGALADRRRTTAKELLVHYFGQMLPSSDGDVVAELHEIVECIIEAAVAEAKAERLEVLGK